MVAADGVGDVWRKVGRKGQVGPSDLKLSARSLIWSVAARRSRGLLLSMKDPQIVVGDFYLFPYIYRTYID